MDPFEIASTLARTPGIVRALTAGLAAEWLHRNDGPRTWSAYDIVGHLFNADETNWLPRTRMILQHGSDRAFEPFDREAMLRWEPESIDGLLDRFQAVRAASVEELLALHLSPPDLDRRGLHPDVGEVTLGELWATWVAHDLTHIAQIAEVLARRYRHAVGPWRAFMPALDRVADAE
jgi:hypothetical protein